MTEWIRKNMGNITAGALLAEMMRKREHGEDTAELENQFAEQSKKQLGGYCSEFSVSSGGNQDAGY